MKRRKKKKELIVFFRFLTKLPSILGLGLISPSSSSSILLIVRAILLSSIGSDHVRFNAQTRMSKKNWNWHFNSDCIWILSWRMNNFFYSFQCKTSSSIFSLSLTLCLFYHSKSIRSLIEDVYVYGKHCRSLFFIIDVRRHWLRSLSDWRECVYVRVRFSRRRRRRSIMISSL